MSFNYENILVRPSPSSPPRIFIGGFAMQAVKRAARIGDGYLVGPKNPDDIEPRLDCIEETLADKTVRTTPLLTLFKLIFSSQKRTPGNRSKTAFDTTCSDSRTGTSMAPS